MEDWHVKPMINFLSSLSLSFFLSSFFLRLLQNIGSSSRSLEHQVLSFRTTKVLSELCEWQESKKLSSGKQGSSSEGEEKEERRVNGSSRTSGWYNFYSVVEKNAQLCEIFFLLFSFLLFSFSFFFIFIHSPLPENEGKNWLNQVHIRKCVLYISRVTRKVEERKKEKKEKEEEEERGKFHSWANISFCITFEWNEAPKVIKNILPSVQNTKPGWYIPINVSNSFKCTYSKSFFGKELWLELWLERILRSSIEYFPSDWPFFSWLKFSFSFLFPSFFFFLLWHCNPFRFKC